MNTVEFNNEYNINLYWQKCTEFNWHCTEFDSVLVVDISSKNNENQVAGFIFMSLGNYYKTTNDLSAHLPYKLYTVTDEAIIYKNFQHPKYIQKRLINVGYSQFRYNFSTGDNNKDS